MASTSFGSSSLIDNLLGVLPLVVIGVHLLAAPYSKVEESFNIQAIHDLLYYGIPTKNIPEFFRTNYDHFEFPGSVPRTFVGAVILSGVVRPLQVLFGGDDGRFLYQMLARGVLALFNGFAIASFRTAVDTAYGKTAGRWYIIFQVTQFHVMFYASRTLPNMFAFGLTTIALRSLILSQTSSPSRPQNVKRRRLALYLLTVAGILFRSEIAILLATQTAYLLLRGRTSLTKEIIPAGLFGAVIGLATTVSVDSFFWQRFPLWPEWSGFYYNTILGKSSDWGVSPWHYYFINAIPRLLMNPLTWTLCIPLALSTPALRNPSIDILAPLVSFVAIYSALPHKEARFIMYIVPGLTAVAAAGASWIWTRRTKSLLYRAISLALMGSTVLSALASFGVLYISSLNYPGGAAISRLHELVPVAQHKDVAVHVYMDNLACQTGVTRFLEENVGRGWAYDKTEDADTLLDPAFWARFEYVLAERPERVIGAWEVLDTVYGYAGVGLARSIEVGVDAAPLVQSGSGLFNALLVPYNKVALFARRRFTGGLWPVVKVAPRLYVLKKQDPAKFLDDTV